MSDSKKIIYANTELYFLPAGSFNSCVFEKTRFYCFYIFVVYEYIPLILAMKRALKMKIKIF